MYLEHFGLHAKPFSLNHDLDFYYPPAHEEATDALFYAIEERQGLAILIGRPGTGKTTLLKKLTSSLERNLRGVFVTDVSLPTPRMLVVSEGSVLRQLCHELLLPHADTNATAQLLHNYLRDLLAVRQRLVVFIDEAQELTGEQLQEVRLLTDLEHGDQKLLQVVLAGQPSLNQALERSDLEALRQRAAVRTSVEPLDASGTAAYIQFRLSVAGGPNPELFTPDAAKRVAALSHGIPRLINLICDRALLVAYAGDALVVEEGMVETAGSELKVETDERDQTLEEAASGQPSSLEPSAETRLTALETKVDNLLELLTRAGVLSGHDPGSMPPPDPDKGGASSPSPMRRKSRKQRSKTSRRPRKQQQGQAVS